MTSATLEKYYEAIDLLGEDTIEQLYLKFGAEKISFATLKNLCKKQRILKEAIKGRCITHVAKQYKVNRTTIYRLRNNKKDEEESDN